MAVMEGDIVAIKQVLHLPPKLSCNILVNFESLVFYYMKDGVFFLNEEITSDTPTWFKTMDDGRVGVRM